MSAQANATTTPTVIDADSFERWSGETSDAIKALKSASTKRQTNSAGASATGAAGAAAAAAAAAAVGVPRGNLSLERNERFPVDIDLNRKVVFCKSDVTKLKIQVIVNPTNEALNSLHGVSVDIMERAGAALVNELATLEGCKTGHSKITRAYNLPSDFIIHTVGPRYNDKYHIAAENALHNCYRNTLQLMREKQLRSIALSVVNSQRKGYPPESGAHIALRTVRRFLEHYRDAIDLVMFVMVDGAVDYSVYKNLLPLYFPRNEQERHEAIERLPLDCGDEFGETLVEERKIRIGVAPTNDTSSSSTSTEKPVLSVFANESTIVHDDELKPAMLATMSQPPDLIRQQKIRENASEIAAQRAAKEQYDAWLFAAEKADLADIARLRYAYRAGGDASGREAVVILGRQLPATQVDLHRVLLHVVRVLASLNGRAFALIYIHGGVQSHNDAPFAWLRQVYGLLDYPHQSQLSAFYVVHPTFFLKAFFTLLSPVLSTSFNEKIRYVDGLSELFSIFPRAALQLPEEIFKADTLVTGKRWDASSSSSSAAAASSSF